MIRLDTENVIVNRGDYIVQCTDGVWCFVTETEILETVSPREVSGRGLSVNYLIESAI